LRLQRSGDEGLARGLDRVELRLPLLAGELFQRLHAATLAQIVSEHSDIDVLGKPRYQPERLGERGSALEQQSRAGRRQPVEQRVEGPADPKILLDILLGGAKPPAGGDEGVAPVVRRRSQERIEPVAHWPAAGCRAVCRRRSSSW
jgi:hypothetical protein